MSVIVKGLFKKYEQQVVVENLNFEAHPGKILGFLGPNGAGKTTTMKMLCCYTKPTSGTAEICGFDILERPLDVRHQIGYLAEHNPLYDEMYIKEYLQFVASIHRLENRKARIDDVIAMTGLGREQNKIIGTLSKGYRQRVGLAQAIIHDPKVLILDEPTSGLDMNQLQDIRALIIELSKEKTVIFSSHIMQEVEALCQQVIIIDQGVMVANESIEMLRNRLKGNAHIYIELQEKNVSKRVFENIQGITSISQIGDQWKISFDNDTDIRGDIFRSMVGQGLTIIGMHREKANVEDVFRQLTKKETYA